MKKRLIALMLGATITATALTGCGAEKTDEEINNENEIRQMLEYDADISIDKKIVVYNGFDIDFEINDHKFYITFKTITPEVYGSHIVDDKIKYEVDKDFYYDFKNNYDFNETKNEVERVKNLTEQYDPVEVFDAIF